MLFLRRKPILLWLAATASASLLLFSSTADAFSVTLPARTTTVPRSHSPTPLYMSTEESSSEEVMSEEQQQMEDGEPEAEAEPEDPALTALKEEISALESTLKQKRRDLAYTSDQADEYSQSGYARKVAEMENMRRARSMLNSSNKSGAMAAVLSEFLPILDRLYQLNHAFGEDDFGKQYGALAGALKTVFSELGVTEYTAAVGESAADTTRFVAVEALYSEEYAAETVLEPRSVGLELQGNIIRAAECVVSLGPEQPPEEEGESSDEAAPEGDAAAE